MKNRQAYAHSVRASTLEQEASENAVMERSMRLDDPILFCTAFKRNRFFLFTQREPPEVAQQQQAAAAAAASAATRSAPAGGTLAGLREPPAAPTSEAEWLAGERDVFNEKPTKEDMMALPSANAAAESSSLHMKLGTRAILHTSMGDVELKLFSQETPKTVENFCTLARRGYYNSHIFHRVIKGFIVQTGDPLGNGTGGESIWGGEFEDEFHPQLKHDRPFTVRCAVRSVHSAFERRHRYSTSL